MMHQDNQEESSPGQKENKFFKSYVCYGKILSMGEKRSFIKLRLLQQHPHALSIILH